jgi:hypothetical protein
VLYLLEITVSFNGKGAQVWAKAEHEKQIFRNINSGFMLVI